MENNIYFLELDKQEIKLMKDMCETYYRIAKENYSFKKMLESRNLSKRLECLLKR